MERVTYKENEVTLLENFNIQIVQGEIMGLLPVNAHGLSAFLALLETNLPLYDGYIFYGEETVNSWKSARRTRNRISVIGAENRLVETLNVTDNIFVLRQGFKQEIIRTRLLQRQLAPFLEDIGMKVSSDLCVERLTVFERVILELLRAVVLGHRLIVLNEIGTLLSYEEMERLYGMMHHYSGRGFSFLYICPHYEELSRICERSALLSNGRIVKIVARDGMADEILKLYSAEYERMVRYRLEKRKKLSVKNTEVLRISHLQGEAVQDFSMEVYRGECLAVQILENERFLELRELITGNRDVKSGEIVLEGRRQTLAGNPGIGVIPELATKTMIFPELSYMENLCISLSGRIPGFWCKSSFRKSIRQEYGPVLGQEVFDAPVELLSERQKYQLIYTRVLLARPSVVFCIQPFKGADLSHRMFIWKMLEMLQNHGIAVVLLSLNLSDALSIADRFLVFGKGERQELWRKDFASISEIVPWMHLYRD